MGSDWDYINDNMGGWNDDGMPNFTDDPCFNTDYEDELRENGHKTVAEWNSLGRSVKKGEKGIFLRCAKIKVFGKSQTTTNNYNNKHNSEKLTEQKNFETFVDAISWAKANPGRVITRVRNGEGFIVKS